MPEKQKCCNWVLLYVLRWKQYLRVDHKWFPLSEPESSFFCCACIPVCSVRIIPAICCSAARYTVAHGKNFLCITAGQHPQIPAHNGQTCQVFTVLSLRKVEMRLSRMIFRRLLPQEQKARVDPSMRNGMPLLRAVLIQLQKIRALQR